MESTIAFYTRRCNELENPIGIETRNKVEAAAVEAKLQRTWKPDRDWNFFSI